MFKKNALMLPQFVARYTTRTPYKIAILLFLAFIVGSCKKDLLLSTQIKSEKDDRSRIQSITYSQFLASINLNKVGSLKDVLQHSTGAGKVKKMTLEEASTTFELDMDSVKKLVLGDSISYVIALKPKTLRAVHFENITVQVVGSKTTAFITTYIPTKEWIVDWRGEKHLPFKGEIYVNRISLTDVPQLNVEAVASSKTKGTVMSAPINNITINESKISLVDSECEIYDVYTLVPYPCSTGDYPGHCQWENNVATMTDLDRLPGYKFERSTVFNCGNPFGGGSGGDTGGGTDLGGGGNTTPNPPGTYDPCDNTPQPVGRVSYTKGAKFMVTAPTDCDPTTLDPSGPVEAPAVTSKEFLIGNLSLTPQQQLFVNEPNNIYAVNILANFLLVGGLASDNKDYILWGMDYLITNPTENSADFMHNFFTISENSESDPDDNNWYENTPIPQGYLPLPTRLAYIDGYPKILRANGDIITLPARDVYTIIGGSLDVKNKAKIRSYQNACALRGSRALNYAGLPIPILTYENKKATELGGDGKNYILSAASFQKYMTNTFGAATYKITNTEIGNNISNIKQFLRGKTGIFVMKNLYPGRAGYSGHVDYVIDGSLIDGASYNPDGGIEKIEVWELNP